MITENTKSIVEEVKAVSLSEFMEGTKLADIRLALDWLNTFLQAQGCSLKRVRAYNKVDYLATSLRVAIYDKLRTDFGFTCELAASVVNRPYCTMKSMSRAKKILYYYIHPHTRSRLLVTADHGAKVYGRCLDGLGRSKGKYNGILKSTLKERGWVEVHQAGIEIKA